MGRAPWAVSSLRCDAVRYDAVRYGTVRYVDSCISVPRLMPPTPVPSFSRSATPATRTMLTSVAEP
jgi:hypothetical protein